MKLPQILHIMIGSLQFFSLLIQRIALHKLFVYVDGWRMFFGLDETSSNKDMGVLSNKSKETSRGQITFYGYFCKVN